MDELVAKIAAECGVDPDTARTVAIILLKFVAEAAPAETSAKLIDALPGASGAMATSNAGGESSLIGVFNDLTGTGLGTEQIQAAAHSLGDVGREKAGKETVDAIVASVPGLGPFV